MRKISRPRGHLPCCHEDGHDHPFVQQDIHAGSATALVKSQADREIRVSVLPREEAFAIPDLIRTKINLLPEGITEVRTIEIVGLDLQADGGTHVSHTGEIGRVRVTCCEAKGRINKRIRIAIHDPA